jgi:hypothetical protein
MMRSSIVVLAVALACATPAAAQDSRVFANINFGYQVQDQDLRQTAAFPLYDETASWEATHALEGGPIFDLGAGFRVLPKLSIGASYTLRTKQSRDVTVNASIPSPIFTDTFRAATASATGLEYTEQAFHVQAFWHIPVTVEFDVTLFGGPTFFQVKNDLISGISEGDVVEAGGDFSSVSLQNISTTRPSESTVGFNIGIDGTYMFMRNAGIGAMVRYSRGSADLAAPAGTGAESFSIDAGGLEIAAGLRFRF